MQECDEGDSAEGAMPLRELLALQKLLHDGADQNAEGLGAVQHAVASAQVLGQRGAFEEDQAGEVGTVT